MAEIPMKVPDILALIPDGHPGNLTNAVARTAILSLDSAQNLGGGRKRPIASFAKIYASVSAPSLLNFISLGDSMAEFKPSHFLAPLQRTMSSNADFNAPNTAGTSQQTYVGSYCGVGTNAGYTFLTSQWAYWPAGELHRIASGGSVTWTYGGVNPTFTKLKVYYITEPGGGVLTVTVNGVLQTTIDTGTGFNGIGLGIYNFSQARAQNSVVVACTSGAVKLVEVHEVDETVSGINYFFSSQGGVALSDMMSTATGRANLQTYLTDAAIDLCTFEAKEATIEPDGSTYAFRLSQFADILDAAIPNADKVMIASTPVAVNDADQVVCNATLASLAQTRGYIFWDGYTPIGSYAKMVALNWQGDGIHPAQQCRAYLADLLFQDLGFDRVIWGLNPRAVSNRGAASQLGRGTSVGNAVGKQLTADADVAFGLDWFLKTPRMLAFAKDDVVAAGTVTATAGAATFSTSQAGVVAAGTWLVVGGALYVVLTFDGTTGATLSGSPTTFGASAFSVRTIIAQFSGSTGTHANVLPMSWRFDTELAGPGVVKDSATGQVFLKFDDTSRAAPSLLPIQAGAVYPGSYTKAQLPAVANSRKGMIAVASDAGFDGTPALVAARGLNTTDYVPVMTGLVGVSADIGDAALAISVTTPRTVKYNSPITANRAVTIAASLNLVGGYYLIKRTAAATGAFTVDVGPGPLKSLAAGQWVIIEYNTGSSAWEVSAFGSL